jgi:hypothetical protein
MYMLRTALATAVLGLAMGMASPVTYAGSALVAANGANSCSGTLPAYQTQLRARPLALKNEGSSAAFVSCSFESGYAFSSGKDFGAYIINTGASDADVSCTGVDGLDATLAAAFMAPAPVFVSKSATIPAGGAASLFFFVPADFPTLTGFNGMTCLLPPGVGISLAGKDYTDTAP